MTGSTEQQLTGKCAGAGCGNEAGALQCPTCLKLGLKNGHFCSQDCFKRNWVCLRAPPLAWMPS